MLYTHKLWAEDALGWFTQYIYSDWVPYTTRPGGRFIERVGYLQLCKEQYLIVGRGSAKSIYDECHHGHHLVVNPKTSDQLVVAPSLTQANETLIPLGTAISRAKGPLFKFMTRGSNRASNSRVRTCMLSATTDGIFNHATNSSVKYRPMRIDKLQGYRGDLVTFDEWLSVPIHENAINSTTQGMSKNAEYLLIATSSEGCVRNGPGDSIKMDLAQVLNGTVFAPEISIWWYKLDDITEIGDKTMWMKAMPTIGITPLYSAVEADVRKMERDPSVRNDIIAKRFGIPTEGLSFFFEYEETIPHPATNYDGLPCAIGCDFSRGDDFCTVAFMFPDEASFGVDTLSFVLERNLAKLDSALYEKYQEFIAEGSLIVLPQPVMDMDVVYEMTVDYIYKHNYAVLANGYDKYNAELFVKRWECDFPYCLTERVVQGPLTESVPLGELKTLARDRMLMFSQSIVQFTMGNACVRTDVNGNRALYKKNRESKIDCVAAMIDAMVAYGRARDRFRR